jgi:hypothetical protein
LQAAKKVSKNRLSPAEGTSFAGSYRVYYRHCSGYFGAVINAAAYFNGHVALVDDFEFYTFKPERAVPIWGLLL